MVKERTKETTELIRTRSVRGKEFEEIEKRVWRDQIRNLRGNLQDLKEEETLKYRNSQRSGRMDIHLDDGEWQSIIEVKSTDWDKMAPHRVRPNVMRHKRQVIRYVYWYWEQGIDTVAGLTYPTAPKKPGRRELVESILEEWSIQCVWADERPDYDHQ